MTVQSWQTDYGCVQNVQLCMSVWVGEYAHVYICDSVNGCTCVHVSQLLTHLCGHIYARMRLLHKSMCALHVYVTVCVYLCVCVCSR